MGFRLVESRGNGGLNGADFMEKKGSEAAKRRKTTAGGKAQRNPRLAQERARKP